MLDPDKAVFVLVDVQGRLAQLMHAKEALFDNLQRLIKGLTVLDIPIIWMEQIPDKMGKTIPELSALLADRTPIAKSSFSCYGCPAFREALQAHGREQVLIAGIETHVCVYQTAVELVEAGQHVEVVADAVSSRAEQNRAIGLERIRAAGARLTSVEMVLFELMRSAEHAGFRELLRIVR